MRFRTTPTRARDQLAAADRAFGSLGKGALGPISARINRFCRAITPSRRLCGRCTVALVYVRSPNAGQLSPDVLSQGFATALATLNQWLISLGVLYDDRLRPLTIGDLPPVIPVFATTVRSQGLEHVPAPSLVLEAVPVRIRTYDDDELQAAQSMLAIVSQGSRLALFYELVQRAGSARGSHRAREAVIDYATAGELFITDMLRRLGERHEMRESTLNNVLKGTLPDRALHLSRLLHWPDDPQSPQSPLFLWWLHCYQPRNKVVHEGVDIPDLVAEAARIGLVELVVNVREEIRKNPATADLVRLLQWAHRVDETGGGKHSLPDPL